MYPQMWANIPNVNVVPCGRLLAHHEVHFGRSRISIEKRLLLHPHFALPHDVLGGCTQSLIDATPRLQLNIAASQRVCLMAVWRFSFYFREKLVALGHWRPLSHILAETGNYQRQDSELARLSRGDSPDFE